MASRLGRPPGVVIALRAPHLVAELVDPSLAHSVSGGSNTKIEWLCLSNPLHGTYMAAPTSRVNMKSGCPACAGRRIVPGVNDLQTTHPGLASELVDPALAAQLSPGSNKPVLWRCARDKRHGTYQAQPVSRTKRGSGCPACAGRKVVPGVNDLLTTRPDLAHILAVPELATHVTKGHTKPVEWKCLVGRGHPNWTASPRQMSATFNGKCPVCVGARVVPGVNDLATLYPEVAASLVDPALGSTLTPRSNRVVEWRCLTDPVHMTWRTSVANRTAGTGCAVCSNKRVQAGVNDIATTAPWLAAQLVEKEVGYTVTVRSEKRLEWQCAAEPSHRWVATVSNRYIGRGCPQCARSGFKVNRPAFLYVVLCEDLYGHGAVIQYGVTNDLSARLAKHAARGFSRVPLAVFTGPGRAVLDAEREVKTLLHAAGVLSCHEDGIVFDGSTESHFVDRIAQAALQRLIRKTAEVRGLTATVSTRNL